MGPGAGGDLRLMAAQVRSAIAWVYKNAASFGADANKLYIGGRSSGAHLTAVALVTDWERDYGVPTDIVKGGICSSGIGPRRRARTTGRVTATGTGGVGSAMGAMCAPSRPSRLSSAM